jgi:hypothetical protein
MRVHLPVLLALGLAAAPIRAGARPADAVDADESLGLGRLMHASPQTVRDRLGEPDVSRAEGKGALWTYRLPRCALYLFFHDGPKGLKVSGASTGPRRRGDALLTVSDCIATAARPSDTAGTQ